MSNRFIKLSKMVINTSAIKSINIDKKFTDSNIKSYLINFKNGNPSGFIFGWFGSLTTNEEYIRVNEDDSPEDYKIVSNWIDSICNSSSK